MVLTLGLLEYDPDGRKAEALEEGIGIKVIRHSMFYHSTLENFIFKRILCVNWVGLAFNVLDEVWINSLDFR